MIRTWPLDAFQSPLRYNKWNKPIPAICMDCEQRATLWVEFWHRDPQWPQSRTKKYGRLCEPCCALRILGDNEEAK